MNDLIRSLVEAYGPSGFEDGVRDLIRPLIEPHADDVTGDAPGNLIAHKRATTGEANPLKVMIAAHMDEIGIMVSHITEKGFLRCFETRTAGASHLRFVLQGVKTGAAARGFACGIGVGYPVAEANDRGELNVMRIVPISSLWQRLRGLFQAVTGSLRIST